MLYATLFSLLSSVSRVIGIKNTVEKKKRLTKVIKRQADSPESISFKNSKWGLARISQRRTINPNEWKHPMIRNKHWKWAGSKIVGLCSKLSTSASPLNHKYSKWSSWSHSKFFHLSMNDLTVKPAWRTIFQNWFVYLGSNLYITYFWPVDNGACANWVHHWMETFWYSSSHCRDPSKNLIKWKNFISLVLPHWRQHQPCTSYIPYNLANIHL